MAPADHVLEDEANDRPGDVVHRGCGWNEGRPREDDGEVDVFDEGVRILARDEVAQGGEKSADEEEEDKRIVDLSFGKLKARSDDTPLKYKIASV